MQFFICYLLTCTLKTEYRNAKTEWITIGTVTGADQYLDVSSVAGVYSELRAIVTVSITDATRGTFTIPLYGTYNMHGYYYSEKYNGSIAVRFANNQVSLTSSWTKLYGEKDMPLTGATLTVQYKKK